MTSTSNAYETGPRGAVDTQCHNCGSFVTRRFARVFGDNRDRVHGCLDCMTATDVKRGEASEHPR